VRRGRQGPLTVSRAAAPAGTGRQKSRRERLAIIHPSTFPQMEDSA
jgi:hypothetical protein